MTGVIWFVQVVHYPLILLVPSSSRITYCKTHAKRTSFVVLPPMLVELGTAIAMCFLASGSIYWFVNLLLLILIWMSTFLIQVPLHNHLGQKTEDSFVERLVATNWIRTALWTLRSVMLLIWLYAHWWLKFDSMTVQERSYFNLLELGLRITLPSVIFFW